VKILGVLDFVVRFAFFALMPATLFFLSKQFPVTGAVINLAVVLTVFFLAALIRGRAEKRPWVARILRRQLAYEAYYREHPPKPFLYYVFFPLLLPYWLVKREARREVALYWRYGVLTFVILGATAIWEYFKLWRPELGLEHFGRMLAVMFAIEFLLVLVILMPIMTTVVDCHLRKRRVRLFAYLAVAVVMIWAMAGVLAKRRHEVVSFSTTTRMFLRSHVDPYRCVTVRAEALKQAILRMMKNEGTLVKEGDRAVEILGPPVDAARAELLKFYKRDETLCFHLVALWTPEKGRMLILFGDASPIKRPSVWIGLNQKGQFFTTEVSLPPEARELMAKVGKR
jgi:hypothetical protein